MMSFRTTFGSVVLAIASTATPIFAQDLGQLPKYGSLPRSEAQQAADDVFRSSIDAQYGGDRAKASGEMAARGWQYLRQGNNQDAMRRFNQAWLLDKSNGQALWGMASVLTGAGKTSEALKLFSEADRTIGNDIDFSVDYAKALGIAGVESRDDVLVDEAFSRFRQNFERDPQHVLNLQDWAVTLFYVGQYAEAWKKVQLAEATPRRSELDRNFIAALQAKMPRP